ncbi:MAG: hypothetical protein HY960_08650 [Ignavibacteriae bacterium]|nr:hypothetical protein [Ignavibacteriota bacterium]
MIEKDGVVRLPSELQGQFNTGSHVTVRLTSGGLSSSLKKLGVTEEEIERIARLQMEERADVVRFLKTEGSLKRNREFIRRASELLGERT